jgi:hypothetical protein
MRSTSQRSVGRSGCVAKDAKLRWKNFSSLHRYSETLLEKSELPTEWTETLTPEQEDLEKWMLALSLVCSNGEKVPIQRNAVSKIIP